MHALLLAAFESFNLCAVFGLSSAAVGEFTRGAEAAMRCTNTFHNFGHVFNVAGTAWRMVAEGGCREDGLLCDLDVFALLCAAICHDLGHPGHTNAFELATCSDLSMLYNDRSVLENHHAAVGSALLRDTGLLDGLLPDERAEFRSLFLAAVLATDMAAHRQLVADVQARVGEAAPGRALRGGDLAGRTLAVAYILHAADLCCPLFPVDVSHSISAELSIEFELQAGAEKARSLPVTVVVAGVNASPAERAAQKARMEIGFLKFVVIPLYMTLGQLIPKLEEPLLARIHANLAAWERAAGARPTSA